MSRLQGRIHEPIPQGTLDMLILRTWATHGRQHGFEIANSIHERSEDVLFVKEGSLYPALQRLLIRGRVTGEWGRTDDNRRARYYKLTPADRKYLAREVEQYRCVSAAIGRILEPAGFSDS